jgi:hypothetical protein
MATPIYKAFLMTRYASEYLLTAHTLENVPEKSPDTWTQYGLERLKEAASELGYDLVKRQDKLEAA